MVKSAGTKLYLRGNNCCDGFVTTAHYMKNYSDFLMLTIVTYVVKEYLYC